MPSLVPLGELQPGIPVNVAQFNGGTDMYVITKSGGFGGVDVFGTVVTAASEEPHQFQVGD